MPPFLAFRLWLREGPSGERAVAGVVAAVVLAVLVAALVPVANGSGNNSALTLGAGPAGAGQPGAPGSTTGTAAGGGGTTAGANAPGAGGINGGSGPTGTGATGSSGGNSTTGGTTSSACGALRASAPGVTPTEVHLDMANLSLAGPVGNSTFNVRPDLKQIAAALAADINAHGGVACGRKLVLKQYDVNPLNSNDSHSKCLQMAADHPFQVFNFGSYLTPADRQCFVHAHVLEQSASQVDRAEAQSSYPYLYAAPAVAEQMVDVAIAGMAARHLFTAPKFKIGLFEDACDPPVNKEIAAALARAGVKSSQISTYTLDCSVSAPPNQIEQGVLQHKFAKATHVLLASSETNDQNYVRIAEKGQNYHPSWLVSDYGSNTSGAGTTNWDAGFDGAIAVTTTRVGELSSGIHNAQEVACDKALRAHNVKGISSENSDTSAMDYCDMFAIMRQALDRAGANPTQLSFMQALGTMGLLRTVALGDGNFHQAGKVTGGDYEREMIFRSSCSCWRIVDKTMRSIQ